MKKTDYRGWQEVFRFSFEQGFKQKSFKGFLIIICVLFLFGPTVLTLFQSGEDSEEIKVTVENLYVFDEVGLPIDYENAFAETAASGVKVSVREDMTFEEYTKSIEETEDSKDIGVQIRHESAGYFQLNFVRAAEDALEDDECDVVGDTFTAFFEEAKRKAIDVSEEQMAFINQSVDTQVLFTDESGTVLEEEEKEEGISLEEYYVLLGGIMICMMIITLNGGSVANAIVTEKSTRVVEYLMINVRPMALIVGKILSCLSLTMIQFGVMGGAYLGSTLIQKAVFSEAELGAAQESTSILQMFSGLSVVNVILAVLIVLMGVLFFSILAGLAGASVSKMEELAEGMKVYQMVQVIGAYIGIGICLMEMIGGVEPLIINICGLIPISTPFIVPAMLLTGRMTTVIALIGFVLLTVITIVLYLFTASVYESMIFYNGKVLKFKDILAISKVRSGKGAK
ncbi:MAG: hypothetical protein IJZ82_00530 [Lachnospiraceae bacterium]|nr:hypothetical protein [Lachnospiraceae bacterium]